MSEVPFTTSRQAGVTAGPVRRPDNFSKHAKGSIHDNATAQRLGFKGGTVAGNIHFEQFPPLMAELFGRTWFQTGNLSLYFLTPTTDGEPVQVFARDPVVRPEGGLRAEVWMEDAEGRRVCEGTAASGPPDLGSALRQRLRDVRPPEDLRILQASKVGDACRDISARLELSRNDNRLEFITEALPEYLDASVWGERVAPPAIAIDAMREVETPLFRPQAGFVGMFGAIEVQWLDGPVFMERDYLADGTILALSESPKTEVAWYESTLRDAKDGREVSRMILMTRVLKGSSPLWT
ncbi:hypothetical protein [Phenylobacterium sp.]|uniref:hypothetical protein n=1 Tax=Phenylobacterium sp. TaxID=1871053 RepID=UPI00286E5E3A|nr:hypothetical protein [Phenylobacterium sp.]